MNSMNVKCKRLLAAATALMLMLSLFMTSVTPALAVSNTPLKAHAAIGYWLGGNGGSNKTLAQASSGWDIINVSFIETSGNSYTPSLNMGLWAAYSGTQAQQTAAFKADIRSLQAQGKKIVISCGGQNGVVHLDNAWQRDIFLNGVKAIIDEYGFDGFDVDFEGSSITRMNADRIGHLVTQQSINLAYILRNLKSTYGSNFIISAAPEYAYVQGGAISTGNFGSFLPVLDACRDILTYIHPQYYNGYNADFTWLPSSANAGAPFTQVYSAEGYVRLSEMLITGFVSMDKGTFAGLRPDQVAFGVPARDGAGNGAQSVSVYASALRTLLAKYPTYRGVMTWSIGWDETGGNSFINTLAPIITAANGSSSQPTQPGQLANGNYYITAVANNQVVCADDYGNIPLTANRGAYGGEWEQFALVNNSDGTVSLRSAANNLYVCAVIDESNQLLARSSVIDAWEKFRLVKVTDSQFALQSVANGMYVAADLNNGGVLTARSASVAGAWEAFVFHRL